MRLIRKGLQGINGIDSPDMVESLYKADFNTASQLFPEDYEQYSYLKPEPTTADKIMQGVNFLFNPFIEGSQMLSDWMLTQENIPDWVKAGSLYLPILTAMAPIGGPGKGRPKSEHIKDGTGATRKNPAASRGKNKASAHDLAVADSNAAGYDIDIEGNVKGFKARQREAERLRDYNTKNAYNAIEEFRKNPPEGYTVPEWKSGESPFDYVIRVNEDFSNWQTTQGIPMFRAGWKRGIDYQPANRLPSEMIPKRGRPKGSKNKPKIADGMGKLANTTRRPNIPQASQGRPSNAFRNLMIEYYLKHSPIKEIVPKLILSGNVKRTFANKIRSWNNYIQSIMNSGNSADISAAKARDNAVQKILKQNGWTPEDFK